MKPLALPLALFALILAARAELKLPAIISDHMVLQQKLANPIWGWDEPGTKVTVTFAGQTKTAEAGADGKWVVKLDPVPANAEPQSIEISGTSQRSVKDVLVGEVWMCSGQSNMEYLLKGDTNGDVEALASTLPNMRLIKVPNVGTQEPQKDFKGAWVPAANDSALSFSAVGFLFGRYIHETLQVPVGLIDNSWGGSAAEAWVRRESLEKDARFAQTMQNVRAQEARVLTPEAEQAFQAQMEKWKKDAEAAKAAGKVAPRQPSTPKAWLTGNSRPGNIFNGKLLPTYQYGIKGVIWYQGETNSGRAYEYNYLFPYMIEQWRKEWNQGDFPFYWVQLADYMLENPKQFNSAWAELREAQTNTLKLPNTGQAVIIDLGEAKDIHPKNKHDVAARLVRWALVKDYGKSIPYRSPEFKSVSFEGKKATVALEMFGAKLRPFDVEEARGFAVCGEDRVWQAATGKIVGDDKIEVKCDAVESPVAVRYAWADNPVANLYTVGGLPVTPFRTDDFPMVTTPQPPAPPAK